ncbi:MAG: SRPBCC domain-containing protein [Acidaminobacteraceae bacterium]
MFIHKSTRLNCDLTMAYRYFAVDKLANKWMSNDCEINLKTRVYNFKSQERNHTGTTIEDFNREEILILNLSDNLCDKEMKVEITFMKCATRTEFCSEIHVVHKGFDLKDDDYMYYQNYWEEALDMLRKIHNRDWIIADGDLSLGILQGSRL